MNVELLMHSKAAAKFIIKHHPQAGEWDNIIEWCAWYISNSFMAALHHPDGRIAALVAARPVNCPEDGNIPYKHAEDGPCIFIDFLAIEDHENPLVYAAFGLLCRDRFGNRERVAYQRVATHDYESFLRNVGRLKKKIGEPSYVATKST